jgi:hypothetical protein
MLWRFRGVIYQVTASSNYILTFSSLGAVVGQPRSASMLPMIDSRFRDCNPDDGIFAIVACRGTEAPAQQQLLLRLSSFG